MSTKILPLLSFFLSFCLITCSSLSNQAQELMVQSPDGRLSIKLENTEEQLFIHLFENNLSIAKIHAGAFQLSSDHFVNGFDIKMNEIQIVDETWQPVYGERNEIRNHYYGTEVELVDKSRPSQKLWMDIRLYDEGLAFKQRFDKNSNYSIKEENTVFQFPSNHTVWTTLKAQGEYKPGKISDMQSTSDRPLVLKASDTVYIALGEAGLVDYARMQFAKSEQSDYSIITHLDSEVDLEIAEFETPWRFVMVGHSPSELMNNNYFILNLNKPKAIEDVSWIEPGKVIREVTLTTQGGKACVDFAKAYHFQFIEFDAGWYGNEYDDASDASTITVDPKRSPGPLDLQEVVDYAKSNDIGVILYVNRRALEKQLDEIFPLYQSWGIAGLKYGFVNVGPQEWTSWLHDAVRQAANYQLMVDIHDEYRPTGYSRTYPNLMTQEGIRGDEESPNIEQTLMTFFVRNLCGAGDFTNCYFDPRVQHSMGGKVGQMAKAIIMYSPWQFLFWYDRPMGSPGRKGGAGNNKGFIVPGDDLEFFKKVHTTWDESITLDGEIGEHAVVARRKGTSWFLGGLTSNRSYTKNIKLDFLKSNRMYEATIYSQDKEDLQNNQVGINERKLSSNDQLEINLLPNSGIAMIFEEIN